MRFATILALAATALGANHVVTLGEGGALKFSPSTVNASIGDTVEFLFYPANHSVVQGNFDSPCTPRDGGYYSGFFFNTKSGPSANSFVISITDPNPIYLYCSQASHCNAGMVGIINPSNDHPFEAYAAAAATASVISSPETTLRGGSVVPTASLTASSGAASSTSGSSESTTTSTETSTSTGSGTTATETSTSTSTSTSASGNGAPMMTQAAKLVAGIAGAAAMFAL